MRHCFAVGAVVLILLGADCGGGTESTTTSVERPAPGRPTAQRPVRVSADRLRDLAHSVGHPVYWAGQRSGDYELTVDVNGNIFIRYLPEGVPAGSRRETALTVATFPFADAYGTLRAAAQRPGAIAARTPDGGLAVAADGTGDNVHIAFPQRNIQIEVYDPHSGRALRLAIAGSIQPLM